MKRVYTLLLVFVLALAALPSITVSAAHEQDYSDYEYLLVEYLFADIYSDAVSDDADAVNVNPIQATLTSAIDGSPFVAYFDEATGRVSMYALNGESMGYRYVANEDAFWELVAINQNLSAISFAQPFGHSASERNLYAGPTGTLSFVTNETSFAPFFDTGSRWMTVPFGNYPGAASSAFVGGGRFNTTSAHRTVSLQSFAFPINMGSMDVQVSNAIGDCVGTLWDMPPHTIATHTIRFPGEPYGARVSSWYGTFNNVELRFFAGDGGTTNPQPTPPPAQNVTLTFHINGGNGANSTITRAAGSAFGTLPNPPTRQGHRFLGWYTTSGTSGGQRVTTASTVPNQATTYWARWAQYRSRTLTHTGSMMITGFATSTHNSTPITFNGNTIPVGALVTDISINTGTSTSSGTTIGNNLQISSSARSGTLTIPWNGTNNSVLNNTHFFWNHDARATYTVRWNGTVIGNTLPGGSAAVRGFSNVRLTIGYIVIPTSTPLL